MKQLGGIDATFLYMETPETPMHVAGLTLFEPPATLSGSFHAHFLEFLKGRLHLAPIFQKRLARTVFELDHPGWVDAGEIDWDYHVRRHDLPAPGTFRQLEEFVGEAHAARLDRARPLWQFTVVEGLEDGNVAIYSKVHHAAVDGGAGMAIAAALYDLGPVPRTVKPPPPRSASRRKPTIEERAALGVHDLVASMARQHLKAMEAVPRALNQALGLLAPKPGSETALPDLADLMAPKTPFNATIGAARAYAARAVSLADARIVARATGAKINDVVMAVCAGALRPYLRKRKALPRKPLVAFVPISLREPGNADASNQVFGMNCAIATQIADPLERLMAIRKASGGSKALAGGVKDVAPKDFSLLGAPVLLPGLAQLFGATGLADLLPSAVNLTISNVPGPPVPLYCAGARILALWPVSIPVHGIALNITVQSYQDQLDFGLTACRKAVPDIAELADLLAPALAELKAAVEAKANGAGAGVAGP